MKINLIRLYLTIVNLLKKQLKFFVRNIVVKLMLWIMLDLLIIEYTNKKINYKSLTQYMKK